MSYALVWWPMCTTTRGPRDCLVVVVSHNSKTPATNGVTPKRQQPAAVVPAASPHSGEWSEAQQLALVAAMKQYGKVCFEGPVSSSINFCTGSFCRSRSQCFD